MTILHILKNKIITIAQNHLTLSDNAPLDKITVELPKNPEHGDFSTNAAMVLAKSAQQKPQDMAIQIGEQLAQDTDIQSCDVAGPGFLNINLTPGFWSTHAKDLLTQGHNIGQPQSPSKDKISLEFVSANPTGPMHIGHCRCAIFGDALGRILTFMGYDVTREYYINDGGAQIDVLAQTLYHRYHEALGKDVGALPEGCYPGDYLKDAAQDLVKRDGDKWLSEPWEKSLKTFAIDKMMDLINADLKKLDVMFDLFVSEHALEVGGLVDEAFDALQAKGYIYRGVLEPPKGKCLEDWEPREQDLLKSTQFGDDVDRPLKKSDNSWTYFGRDLAYHHDKIKRDNKTIINVLGADHGGYVKRLTAAVAGLSDNTVELDAKLIQLVKLLRDGEPLKMSKRAGTIVGISDVLDEVGLDALRFMMLIRRNDLVVDFDVAKVIEKTKDNPVFYVQYAHARIWSVMRHAQTIWPSKFDNPNLWDEWLLTECLDVDLAFIKKLSHWSIALDKAAQSHEPHRVAFYLHELAAHLHQLWHHGKGDVELKFIHPNDWTTTYQRLGMLRLAAHVFKTGLSLLGVSAPEEM
jgi:arginyl-tRNA synthetase